MDSAGRLHVVWHTGNDKLTELHYRVLTGTEWSAEQVLTATGYKVDAFYPVVLAADDRGRVHALWKDNRDGPHAIYYRSWGEGTWGPEELVATARDWLTEQEMAVDGDGRVHAVYGLQRSTTCYELHYRCRADTGWTAETILTSEESTYAHNPRIGSDRGGRVHVVWEKTRVQQMVPNLWAKHCLDGQWTAEERLTNLPTQAIHASLAVDAQETLHLTWSDARNDFHNLYYRRWTPADGWSLHERVTSDSSDAYRPAMTTDRSGNVHLVWSDNRDDNKEIYYAMRSPDEPWEPEEPEIIPLSVRCLPNPCYAATRICTTLPAAGEWTVRLFDLQGRVIATMRETAARAGDHEVDWTGRFSDGRRVPLGMYFVRVSGQGQAGTTRLVYGRP